MFVTDYLCQLSTNKIRFRFYNEIEWNLTQLTTRRAVACCRSAGSAVAQARLALLASSPCELYSVSWRPLSSFGLWIILFILLPQSLLPFYFSSDKWVWQVPGPNGVGAHGWKVRVYHRLAAYAEEMRGKNEWRVGWVPPFSVSSLSSFFCSSIFRPRSTIWTPGTG